MNFLTRISSWSAGFITSIIASLVTFIYLLIYGFVTFSAHEDKFFFSTVIPFTIYYFVIASFGFIIVRKNPKSVWYVPILINLVGIILSIVISSIWHNPKILILFCSGLILSLIAIIIGARIGRRSRNFSGVSRS